MQQLEVTALQTQNVLMHQLRVMPVLKQDMGKRLRNIRQHLWLP
jgi:hypothetical protein